MVHVLESLLGLNEQKVVKPSRTTSGVKKNGTPQKRRVDSGVVRGGIK
jgi:hypothetical protein